jgi:hypothetical protein
MRMRWAEIKVANVTSIGNLEEKDSRLFRNIDIFHHCESLASRMERNAKLQIRSFGMRCEDESVVVQ